MHIIRVNYWGQYMLEVLVGSEYDAANPLNLWTMIYRRHMCGLQPPEEIQRAPWWRMPSFGLSAPVVVAAIGWEPYLGMAEQETASAPGDVAKRCQRCRCAAQQGAEGRVGEAEPGLPPVLAGGRLGPEGLAEARACCPILARASHPAGQTSGGRQ